MKNTLVLALFLLLGNQCFADAPYIPKHLTDPNYKAPKVDCEKAMKDANPFIGTTIPTECLPKKEEPKPEPAQQAPQSNTKIGKFLDNLLAE